TRRLAWGGAALGFGGAIKVWAIVPVLVIVVLCLPHLRRAAIFAGGVAAGFLIPVLPFVIASPSRFYDDVVVAQLARVGTRTAASRPRQARSRGPACSRGPAWPRGPA